MKILIVALSGSVHTARWISQIEEEGWDIYLFPSYDHLWINTDLTKLTQCIPFFGLYKWAKKKGLTKQFVLLYKVFEILSKKWNPQYYEKRLAGYIKKIKPDIIHSMETQGAGYLVDTVKKDFFQNRSFPKWWHANWGSDIFIFGRMPEHKPRIQSVLTHCDYYSCECNRDIQLAREFGFTKTCFPVYPNSGGLDAAFIETCRKGLEKTSHRKIIMLKGYQGWAGRALVGIRALARCKDVLGGYTIVIYTNTEAEDIKIASTLLSLEIDVPVVLLPGNSSHKEILHHHGMARISIGLSIGDAISTSLLEAMCMGSFPIQSCTACASDWIKEGVSGLIVPPEDPEMVEAAIRRALADDEMVDNAAQINEHKIREEANFEKLKKITIQSYQTIFNQTTL
jgi:hypothetical protein